MEIGAADAGVLHSNENVVGTHGRDRHLLERHARTGPRLQEGPHAGWNGHRGGNMWQGEAEGQRGNANGAAAEIKTPLSVESGE